MVKKSSCGLIAYWSLARTSSLVTWSLYEMHSILWKHFISMAHMLLCSSAVRVYDSKAYRRMNVTRKHTSCMHLPFQAGFNFINADVVCAVLESISGLKPSSDTAEPSYLKLVTVSSICPLTSISVLMLLALFVISLVFSARISMP